MRAQELRPLLFIPIIFLHSLAAHSQTIPQAGLIANVPLTEQTGTVAHDTSGNGNACTFLPAPNAPAWNGIGLGFAGLSVNDTQSCSFPAALSATARTVAVCADLPSGVQMSQLNGAQTAYGGNLTFPTLLGAANRNGLTVWLVTPPSGNSRLYYQQSTYTGYGYVPSGTNDVSIGWNCFFYEFGSASDSPGTVDHLFRNGVETSSYAVQRTSAQFAPASGAWFLGGGGFDPSLQFVGTIEHVLAWNRLLSSAEVQQSWQALQTELISRGAVFDPPTSQTTDGVADCPGDSQTAGNASGATWCSIGPTGSFGSPGLLTLPTLPNTTWQLNNNAENGTTCVSMESGLPQEEALDWSPKAPHSVMMLLCGINDFTVGEQSPAQVWQRQLAICSLARQAGYEYVTDATLPSWGGEDDNVQALNTLIRANWRSCFSGVVDVANDPRLGAPGAYANGDYFNLEMPSHLSATGQQILGGYTSNVLASLYGATVAKPTIISTSYTEAAADNFVSVQSAPSAVTVTLPSCLGYVAGHARNITNSGSGAVTVDAQQQQLINGSSNAVAVAAGHTSIFTVQPLPLATSGCGWTTGTLAYPSVVVSSFYSEQVGEPVTLTVTATGAKGAPTGSVTLSSDGYNLSTEPLVNGSASLTASTSAIQPGLYPVTASYTGDSNYIPLLSAPSFVNLAKAYTVTTLNAAPDSVSPPATVTLTAKVQRSYSGTAQGTVTFYYAGLVVGSAGLNSSGVANYQASTKGIAAGAYAITAQYQGDAYDLTSTSSAVTVTVQ